MYTENYKSLVQHIEEDRNNGRIFCRKINIIKIPYSKAFHKFNEGPIKNLIVYFTKIEKRILKFVWNHKIIQLAKKKILKKKKKTGDIVLLDFKLYYKLA